MATIKDIAKAAGVSPASVSRVINNGPKVGPETREKIKKIMLEMGYSPNASAKALITQRNHSIGVVLANLMGSFFAKLAHGIEKAANAHNVQIMMRFVSYEKETELTAIETLLEHRHNAMVIHSASLDDQTLIKLAIKNPGMVFIGRYIAEIASQCVWLDNQKSTQLMVDYLVSKGHKTFAMISTHTNSSDKQLRIAGIKQRLAEHGLELNDLAIEYGDTNFEGGETAIQNLLAKGLKFTALFCHNDPLAVGALSMLKAHALGMPEDVSVMGHDDVLLAQYAQPQLTTIHVPIEEMAIKATELAISRANGHIEHCDHGFKYEPVVIERGSVKQIE